MATEAQSAASIPYPEKYHAAVKYVESVAVGPKALQNEAQLLLYGLRQQVTEGPCNTPKPWGWNTVEGAKWQSWHHLGNLSAMEAMRLYVRTLEEEQPNWYAQLVAHEESNDVGTATAAPANPAPLEDKTLAAEDASPPVALKPVVEYAQEGLWVPLPLGDQKRPLPRYEHSAGLVAGNIYVVGGNYGGRYLNDCWRLNLQTSQWTQLTLTAAVSQANGEAASSSASGGGAPPAPATAAAPTLAPLAGHQVAPWRGNLVLIGGHVKGKDAKVSLSVRVLDTSSLTVSALITEGAPVARGGHTASIIGNQVYIFGGEDAGRRTLGDLHVLDLETLTWSEPKTSGPKPSPRSAHAAVVYQSRYLLIFGGGSVATCYSDVSVLDTHTMAWSLPAVTGVKVTPRAGHAGGILGNTWFVVGGGNNVKGCTEMFALDLKDMPNGGPLEWGTVLSIPLRDPLSSEGISILPLETSKVLVAFGGYNGKYQNSVNVFRPSASTSAMPSPAALAVLTTGKADVTGTANTLGPQDEAEPATAAAAMGATSAASTSKLPAAVAPTPAVLAKAAAAAPVEPLADLRAQLDSARKELEVALKEVATAKGAAAHELKLLRTQLAAAQESQAETQKLLDEARAALQREQAKVLKLEAEAAEMMRRLGAMADLEKEVEKHRRLAEEAEEARAKGASGGGLWGYLAGGGGPATKPKA